MNRQAWIRLTLLAGSLTLSVGLFEVGARFVIEPSDRSWGLLGGLELPPLRLLPETRFGELDRSAPHPDLVVDGRVITRGDLNGLIREDEELGYRPLESATSVNGWWQSNGLGARARIETTPERPAGKQRVLVFGESFTQGSRVRQEESWPHLLGARAPALEVINLAVDGYGMGQALLLYRQVRDRVEHDWVVLGFVPQEDLIRDVNTLRALIGWNSAIVMPRFTLTDGGLRLVPSPFRDAEEVRREAAAGIEGKLGRHLGSYDAAFFPDQFTVPPVVGHLVAYKVVARLAAQRRLQRFNNSLMDADSEALRTTRAIFDTMAREVAERGQRFVLVFIPTTRDAGRYQRAGDDGDRWDRVVAAACPTATVCIDLMADFPDREDVDHGYDGTHYGPRMNSWIAERVWADLSSSAGGEATR